MKPVYLQTSAPDPKVSVALFTYKHEKSIAQAIESVLMQKTDFTVELVIGEDCSPDATRDIVQRYSEHYPFVIRPLLHEHNIGIGQNVTEVFKACRGKYIALLEGDDYWTDELKLQQQVDFMEREPDCAVCHHRVQAVADSSAKVVYEYPPEEWRKYRIDGDALIQSNINFIHTCSALYRVAAMPSRIEELLGLPLLDWPIAILSGQNGWIGYIDRCMAVYRLHAGGSWQMKSYEEKCYYTLKMFDVVVQMVDQDKRKKMNEKLDNARFSVTSLCSIYRSPSWSLKIMRIYLKRLESAGRGHLLKSFLFTLTFVMPLILKRPIQILLADGPATLFRKAKAVMQRKPTLTQ